MKRERHDLTPLTRENRLWLENRQSGLKYDPESGKIRGTFKMSAIWDPEDSELTTNPRYTKSTRATHIKDEYQVLIDLKYRTRWLQGPGQNIPSRHPPVFETGKRIQKLQIQYHIPLADLHVHSNDECCLGFNMIYPSRNTFDLSAFIEKDVTAWFYRLSYVERFGLKKARQTLWEEFDHQAGPSKYLAEIRMVDEARPDEKAQCPCNSNSTYGNCHKPLVVQAEKDHLIQLTPDRRR